MHLTLYSKPGCHLCEGLQEKLEQIEGITLDIRDITTREEWFRAYQYEVPVLFQGEQLIPRPSPRASVVQLAKMLQKYRADSEAK